MSKSWANCALAMVLVFVVGCTHPLEWRGMVFDNVEARNVDMDGTAVEIVCDVYDDTTLQFCQYLRDALRGRTGCSVALSARKGRVYSDYLIECSADLQGSGDASNFLVSFPGFLLLAHAWLGYGYDVDVSVKCVIHNTNQLMKLGDFGEEHHLRIRYADLGTTWAPGWSWYPLLCAIPAFVNGFVVMGYDTDVTPELKSQLFPLLAEQVAAKIVSSIRFNR